MLHVLCCVRCVTSVYLLVEHKLTGALRYVCRLVREATGQSKRFDSAGARFLYGVVCVLDIVKLAHSARAGVPVRGPGCRLMAGDRTETEDLSLWTQMAEN